MGFRSVCHVPRKEPQGETGDLLMSGFRWPPSLLMIAVCPFLIEGRYEGRGGEMGPCQNYNVLVPSSCSRWESVMLQFLSIAVLHVHVHSHIKSS